jgi:hypothetical protein
MGISIPGDLAVAGFDDFELAEILHPTLTVVRQPASEMGRVAANVLFESLAPPEPITQGREIVLPVELVVRRSCGCKPRAAKPGGRSERSLRYSPDGRGAEGRDAGMIGSADRG